MSLPNPQWPTLNTPRITKTKFKSVLKEHDSPAYAEADAIWQELIDGGVDPSFALGQYHAESLYGTAGHAVVTKSWGNMLYSESLTLNAAGKYAPGNGYVYAKYSSWADSVLDYVYELQFYANSWGLKTIYDATAKWIGEGNTPGSDDHLRYLNIIINDMISYEYVPEAFIEMGDKMIFNEGSFDKSTGKLKYRYPLVYNQEIYRGTDGTFLKYWKGATSNPKDPSTFAWYLGEVQGSPAWGAIFIVTSMAGTDPTGEWVYIKDIDTSKLIKV